MDCFGICVDVTNSNRFVLSGVLTARKQFFCVHRGVLHCNVAEGKPVAWKYYKTEKLPYR